MMKGASEFTIRTAARRDIPVFLSIQQEAHLSPWSAAGYEAEFQLPYSVMLLAESASGSIAGFIVGRASKDGLEAEILNIGVREAARRSGAGSALLMEFLKICRERGSPSVWLEVRASNHGAKAFYGTFGFAPAGSRKALYSDPSEDADVFCLELRETFL